MANLSEMIHGTKPEVAPYTETSLTEEQINAILANIEAFPDLQQLGNLYQEYMVDAFNQVIPNFGTLLSKGGASAEQMLDVSKDWMEGKMSPDEQAAIYRTAAQSGLASGSMFGPMGASIAARDIGIGTHQLIQKGAQLAEAGGNAAQRWAGLAQGTIMSPSGMMITPQQLAQFVMQNRILKQQTQQARFNVAAMPDPAWSDRGKLLAAYGGMALGGGMGGGGGAGSAIGGSYQAVPAGGLGGSWAGATGQPYDTLGSGSGANTSMMYNAPAMNWGG
jgi:hypothetical protein